MTELDLSKKVADRYLKREVLGEGTYGVVYKAIDTRVILSFCSYFFSFNNFLLGWGNCELESCPCRRISIGWVFFYGM